MITIDRMRERIRFVAAITACLLVFSACRHESRPNERQAKTQLQRVLDGMYQGAWHINQVRRTNGRMTAHDGTRAYVMDVEVDLTIVKSFTRQTALTRGVKMLIDLWDGKTWLLNLVGPSGQRKIVTLQLLWIEKDEGWELVGPCTECGM